MTLKVTDMTAQRGVNYEFEIYRDKIKPETTLNGIAIIDIVDDAKKLVEDSCPGEECRLHFEPGQEARFVFVTPLYSEESDGDAQIMLFLKDASSCFEFSEDCGHACVFIVDEDERETVTISMASAEITAEEGKAFITVTRSGRRNDMVGVHIASWDGTAQQGEDYGGVGANLYFPMSSRSLSGRGIPSK